MDKLRRPASSVPVARGKRETEITYDSGGLRVNVNAVPEPELPKPAQKEPPPPPKGLNIFGT